MSIFNLYWFLEILIMEFYISDYIKIWSVRSPKMFFVLLQNFDKQKLNVTFTFPKKCFLIQTMLLKWLSSYKSNVIFLAPSDQKSFFLQLFQKLSATKRFLMASFTSWRNDFCQTQETDTKLNFSSAGVVNFEFNFRQAISMFLLLPPALMHF